MQLRMGRVSFKHFFLEISKLTPNALESTRSVLKNRKDIEDHIQCINAGIQNGMNLADQLRQEIQVGLESEVFLFGSTDSSTLGSDCWDLGGENIATGHEETRVRDCGQQELYVHCDPEQDCDKDLASWLARHQLLELQPYVPLQLCLRR